MSLNLSYEELLGYTEGEREKWRRWFEAKGGDVWRVEVQRGGRLGTAWELVDHIFLVERRHTERLLGRTPLTEQSGAAPGDGAALWRFGDDARRGLRSLAAGMSDLEAAAPRTFAVRDAAFTLTPRKLLFHVLTHEIRHWAQLATAVRNAGFPPPGDHDLFYSDALV